MMAAIQGLNVKLNEREVQISQVQKQNADHKAEMPNVKADTEARMSRLERLISQKRSR
jgi:hypothetical protein